MEYINMCGSNFYESDVMSSVHENSKLRTCWEHVVHMNCSECQNQNQIVYSQVSIKQAGYIKRAGWNIKIKMLSEQATLSKQGGNCTAFSSSKRHFFLVKRLKIIVFTINLTILGHKSKKIASKH